MVLVPPDTDEMRNVMRTAATTAAVVVNVVTPIAPGTNCHLNTDNFIHANFAIASDNSICQAHIS